MQSLNSTTRKRRFGALLLVLAAACAPGPASPETGELGNQEPVAWLRSPVLAPIHERLNFSAEAAYDPDGDPVAFRFDFGDGSPVEAGDSPLSRHSYLTLGVFEVLLTVSDEHGNHAQARHDITIVNSVAPPYCQQDRDCPWGDCCIEGLCYFEDGELP